MKCQWKPTHVCVGEPDWQLDDYMVIEFGGVYIITPPILAHQAGIDRRYSTLRDARQAVERHLDNEERERLDAIAILDELYQRRRSS